MNHLGDTNKMVETPRTDAEECEMFIGVSTFTPGDVQQAFHFARQLERELSAANDRIKRLEAGDAALNYSIGLDLQNENDALKQRIKRLEEAGDRLADPFNVGEDDIKRWNKAKEAKL